MNYIIIPGDVLRHKSDHKSAYLIKSYVRGEFTADVLTLSDSRTINTGIPVSDYIGNPEEWQICITYRPVNYGSAVWRDL